MVLFPEGTSSNGDGVLKFKGAIFGAAAVSNAPVQPLCIRYRKVNSENVCHKNRDRIYYYGDISFFPHLLGLFSLKSIEVSLSILPAICTINKDRKLIVEDAYSCIDHCYQKLVEA